jgi:hypothetical protein
MALAGPIVATIGCLVILGVQGGWCGQDAPSASSPTSGTTNALDDVACLSPSTCVAV